MRNNKGQFEKGIYQGNGFQKGNKLYKKRKTQTPMLGKKHCAETKHKISIALQGRNKGNSNPAKRIEVRRKISETKKGKNNPNWKGGISAENERIRWGLEYRLWREAVFMRDCYTCQECEKRGGYLQAHHIKRFSDYPKLRFAIDNGVTLCLKCHRKTKNWGGKK